jgi:Cu2+-exporting ATPase
VAERGAGESEASLAIPVAAGLFAPWGVILPISIGALAMSLSTIIVAATAQLFRGLK